MQSGDYFFLEQKIHSASQEERTKIRCRGRRDNRSCVYFLCCDRVNRKHQLESSPKHRLHLNSVNAQKGTVKQEKKAEDGLNEGWRKRSIRKGGLERYVIYILYHLFSFDLLKISKCQG